LIHQCSQSVPFISKNRIIVLIWGIFPTLENTHAYLAYSFKNSRSQADEHRLTVEISFSSSNKVVSVKL